MASMYEIEKMVEAISAQVKALCAVVGIEPEPLPNEEPTVNNETIEELTDPDA